jgi:hypothetical protein
MNAAILAAVPWQAKRRMGMRYSVAEWQMVRLTAVP